MNIRRLGYEESAQLAGATHEVEVTHADLTETVADTDQTLTIPVVAGDYVDFVALKLVTPFKDASDSGFNSTQITIGETDPNRFLLQTQINENGTEIDFATKPVGTDTSPFIFTATDTIDILIESMSAKVLNNVDTGKLMLYFVICPFGSNPAID